MIRALAVKGGVVLGSALASIGVAHAVARWRDFEVGDVSGVVYLYVATPLAAGIAVAVLMLSLPGTLGLARRSAVAFAVVLTASVVVHSWALSHRMIGGWYKRPRGMEVAAKRVDQLLLLVRSTNDEVAGSALAELERRGPAGADALVTLIEEERRRVGSSFVDTLTTIRAAESLAKIRDQRVVPVLESMLRSDVTVILSTFDAAGQEHRVAVFTTRVTAKRLLFKAFGVQSEVETRRPIP